MIQVIGDKGEKGFVSGIQDPSELPNPLKIALLHPVYRIPASEVPDLESELIELGIHNGEFPIEFEYWEGPTQYHPAIHPYESRAPHIVLKGRNCFPFSIVKRLGDGRLEDVPPGEPFRSHPLVNLNS